MLKNHQDFAFFIDLFKFAQKFQKNWRHKFIFRNVCTCFCTWHMQCKVFFCEIFCCVTLRCVFCYITLHYLFTDRRFIDRSKRHTQSACIFDKKKILFSNEDKIIIQSDYEEKSWSACKIWKNHPTKKLNYSSVKLLLKQT